jgi:metal-responsive CopG/Arc/MetJ family transcriptional regulator
MANESVPREGNIYTRPVRICTRMFRPSINGALEDQVEEYMADAGFDNKSDFVRYACRREVQRLRKMRPEGEGR